MPDWDWNENDQRIFDYNQNLVEIKLKGINKEIAFIGRYVSRAYEDMIFQTKDGGYVSRINNVIEEWDMADELIETLLFLMHKED